MAKPGPASVVAAVLCAAALLGCPGRTKRQVGPDIPLPTDGDQQALERFRENRARFEQDGKVEDSTAALAEFEAIAREYPEDPIAAHARLFAGIAALEAGKPERAAENLRELVKDEEANPAVVRRGQLFLGVSLGYLGKHDQALTALKAGADTLDGNNGDERAQFHAAFAEASAATGKLGDAVVHYDAWYPVGRAAERAYALARVRALTDQLDERSVGEVYGKLTGKQGPGAALVGARLAAQLEARGDRDRAEEVRGEIRQAREKLGLVTGGSGGAAGDPDEVGGILSLSGKRNRLGDFSMRGLALAAGTFDDVGDSAARLGFPRPFRLSVRDDASQAAGAAGAVDALAAEGVIAIVGPDDGRAVERAARRAAEVGVPLVSLHPAAELLKAADSPVVFHVVHSAERRARALARQALEAGIRDFAILAPDSGYGRQVGGAFRSEVQRGGGQVTVEVKFKPEATSFAGEIGKLKKPFQALFVPVQAKQLELIAPALAAGNLNARPPGEKTKQGRSIWLLSTADLVGPGFLSSAGRYSWGALLAPGFYADRTDSRIAEFTALYEKSFGRAPTALDAYAFDAAWLVRAAVDAGAKNRRDLAAQLAVTKLVGLTGPIAFDSGHRRRDDGILYEVVQVRADQFELKARR
ncbi:MAG TPA: penicillin-binding protein activator [Kofleriaceae bacterium]|nr:penicillin-binding protein activator [Kofleriaceae bacterium]